MSHKRKGERAVDAVAVAGGAMAKASAEATAGGVLTRQARKAYNM